MTTKIAVLRLDDSVEILEAESTNTGTWLAEIGSELRRNDPTVCAVRVVGDSTSEWMGHHTPEHLAVVVAREQRGQDDWNMTTQAAR